MDEDFMVASKERVVADPLRHTVSWEELKHNRYSRLETNFALPAQDGKTLVTCRQVECVINAAPTTEKEELSRANRDLRRLLERVLDYLVMSRRLRSAHKAHPGRPRMGTLIGLSDHGSALRVALWRLMRDGPPSHGATVRKFTMRAIGASGRGAIRQSAKQS
ncbi:MAG TPA: hypothetical protein VMV27_15915 [Candidatus Binataceae bacterium]|nr:hypothetical protein [Candidatus Binataceae bacterium]